MAELWVIMPVYNEEQCVNRVIEEWVPVLRSVAPDFTLCVLNDGSKDGTLKILREMENQIPELKIVDKTNSGHGQTCIFGYCLAAVEGAKWVFQIDSDGQCDPKYFAEFWSARARYPAIYGFRRKRDDGLQRFLISRVVSLVTFFGTGTWVRDANVPYRLMRMETLTPLTPEIPTDFHLANILITALQQRHFGIHWIDIHFRQRMGGVPSVKAYSFFKQGIRLFMQLRRIGSTPLPQLESTT